jgi:excisionase family DNA binding protein
MDVILRKRSPSVSNFASLCLCPRLGFFLPGAVKFISHLFFSSVGPPFSSHAPRFSSLFLRRQKLQKHALYISQRTTEQVRAQKGNAMKQSRKVPQIAQSLITAEEFITIGELAARLRLTERTIHNYMRREFIPYYKIGRFVRFKWSEVEAALAQGCHINAKAA